MEKMREEFETWVVSEFGFDVSKIHENGSYCRGETFTAWKSWKASRASLCVELPCSLGYPNNDMVYLSDVEDRLEKAGVSYK